jgi:hypothetical protein
MQKPPEGGFALERVNLFVAPLEQAYEAATAQHLDAVFCDESVERGLKIAASVVSKFCVKHMNVGNAIGCSIESAETAEDRGTGF